MNNKFRVFLLVIVVMIFGLIGGLTVLKKGSEEDRTITVHARKYAFDPQVIRVNRGDTITLNITSTDVTHGFYLEGYDFDAKIRPETPGFWMRAPSKNKEYGEEVVESYTFTANRIGKFRYRCSIGCGPMHPFMQGEFIVRPNFLFPGSIGLAFGIAFACIIYFRKKEE